MTILDEKCFESTSIICLKIIFSSELSTAKKHGTTTILGSLTDVCGKENTQVLAEDEGFILFNLGNSPFFR